MFSTIVGAIIGLIIYNKFFNPDKHANPIGLSGIIKTTDKDGKPFTLAGLKKACNEAVKPCIPQLKDFPPKIIGYEMASPGSNMAFYGDPSDVFGVVEQYLSIGCSYVDFYGEYQVVNNNERYLETYPVPIPHALSYISYTPKVCRCCGREIQYEGVTHLLTGGIVNTGILPDSESRYCEHCRKFLNEDKEAYYPFYIDYLSGRPRLITSSNKEFQNYLFHARIIKSIRQKSNDIVQHSPDHAWVNPMYDVFVRMSTETEYTKNMWTAEIVSGLSFLR